MPDLVPLEDAIDSIDAKTPIGSLLRSADWERVPLALRQRAQFSAGVTSAQVLQTIQDRLAAQFKLQREQLANGNQATFDRNSFINSVRDIARAEGLTPTKEELRGGIQDPTSIPRLGLIYDMQNAMATGFARNKLDTSEGALLLFPAYRLGPSSAKEPRPQIWWEQRWSESGAAVDWEGALKDQFVALKTSPIWAKLSRFGTPWAPFDWGSTRELEEVGRDEAISLGLMKPDDLPPQNDGGEDFNTELQASVRGIDPELKASLKESFGKQVKFEGDKAWWTGDRAGKNLATGPKEKISTIPAEPVPETIAPPASVFPEQLDQLKMVRSLGGSTGAKLMQDQIGRQFVVKRGNSPEHIREEFAADSLYQAAGVAVPAAKLYQDAAGAPVKVAQHITGESLSNYLQSATPAEKQAVLLKLQDNFHIDALLGNWDVAGLNLDNIIVDRAGNPWRIDNGGSLRLRAQGTPKTANEWDDHPLDFWTMRDAQTNPKTAQLFGAANVYDLARRIQATDFAKILAAAPADVRATLTARAQNLQDTARKALEYEQAKFANTHADRITEEIMRIREAQVTSQMSTELKQSDNEIQLTDASGRRFDHLRTADKAIVAAAADAGEHFYQKIVPAVKTLNHHHAKGDTDYNTTKVAEAIAQKTQLEEIARKGSANEKRMATEYLKMIEKIEVAKGKKDVVLPKFDKVTTTTPAKAEQSIVQKLAAHMASRGGDWSLVESWAAEQGGSSSSQAAGRLKRWLFERLQGVPTSEIHNLPAKDVLSGLKGTARQQYDRSFEVFHSFIQEFLGKVDFPGNDRANHSLRVLRTEQNKAAVPFASGESGIYNRGVNESGSLYKWVFNGTRTMTAVPHPRITSIYFLERTPGKGNTFLFGDSENEATFMAHGLVAKNVTGKKVSSAPGTDQTKWQTP